MNATRTRSLLISLLTASSEFLLFSICASLLVAPELAAARWLIGAAGASANFALNRRWAFDAREQRARTQLKRFAVTATIAVTMATGLWYGALLLTGWDPRALHLLSMAVVWLTFTYPMMKRWVFCAPALRVETAPRLSGTFA